MKKIIIEVADDEQAMQVVEAIETYVFMGNEAGYDPLPTMYVKDGKNVGC